MSSGFGQSSTWNIVVLGCLHPDELANSLFTAHIHQTGGEKSIGGPTVDGVFGRFADDQHSPVTQQGACPAGRDRGRREAPRGHGIERVRGPRSQEPNVISDHVHPVSQRKCTNHSGKQIGS